MLIGVQEPRAYLRQWSGRRPSQLYQELSLSSGLECQLLEYRNLTLRPLVRPFTLRGQAAVTQGAQQRLLDGSVFVEPVFATVSQHMVHTVDTAIKGWQQVSLETHTHTHTHTHSLSQTQVHTHTHRFPPEVQPTSQASSFSFQRIIIYCFIPAASMVHFSESLTSVAEQLH